MQRFGNNFSRGKFSRGTKAPSLLPGKAQEATLDKYKQIVAQADAKLKANDAKKRAVQDQLKNAQTEYYFRFGKRSILRSEAVVLLGQRVFRGLMI